MKRIRGVLKGSGASVGSGVCVSCWSPVSTLLYSVWRSASRQAPIAGCHIVSTLHCLAMYNVFPSFCRRFDMIVYVLEYIYNDSVICPRLIFLDFVDSMSLSVSDRDKKHLFHVLSVFTFFLFLPTSQFLRLTSFFI